MHHDVFVCIAFGLGVKNVSPQDLVGRYTLKSYRLHVRVIVCERNDFLYSGMDKDFRLEEVL